MTRKEFMKMSSLLGIGLPLSTTLRSCNSDDALSNQIEKVIIIGAGAGGLTAGHLLSQRGINFEILEASSNNSISLIFTSCFIKLETAFISSFCCVFSTGIIIFCNG